MGTYVPVGEGTQDKDFGGMWKGASPRYFESTKGGFPEWGEDPLAEEWHHWTGKASNYWRIFVCFSAAPGAPKCEEIRCPTPPIEWYPHAKWLGPCPPSVPAHRSCTVVCHSSEERRDGNGQNFPKRFPRGFQKCEDKAMSACQYISHSVLVSVAIWTKFWGVFGNWWGDW